MSGRVYLLGVGLALVAGAFVLTDWLLAPPLTPGVTEANVKRLLSRPGERPPGEPRWLAFRCRHFPLARAAGARSHTPAHAYPAVDKSFAR